VQRIEQHAIWRLRTRREAAQFWAAKYAHLGATLDNVVDVPPAFRDEPGQPAAAAAAAGAAAAGEQQEQ
jgi:hypothetical protein